MIQNQSTQIDDLSRKVAILEQTNKKLSESNGSVDNVRSDAAINKSLGDIMKQMQIMSQAQSASRQHIEGHLVNMPPTVTKDIVTIINQKIMPEISKTLNTMRNDLATNLTQENRKSVEKLMLNVKQELFGKVNCFETIQLNDHQLIIILFFRNLLICCYKLANRNSRMYIVLH